MKIQLEMPLRYLAVVCAVAAGVAVLGTLGAKSAAAPGKPSSAIRLTANSDRVEMEMLTPSIFRIDIRPDGHRSPRTLVLDPTLRVGSDVHATIRRANGVTTLQTSRMIVRLQPTAGSYALTVSDAGGSVLLRQLDVLNDARHHAAAFNHKIGENIYGIRGYMHEIEDLRANSNPQVTLADGMLRNRGSIVAAGAQGDGGAPFFFTTHYGVLIDSDGGRFDTHGAKIAFTGGSRNDLEYFVMIGSPMQTISALAWLTGRPPMVPKWTLGFINTQYGTTEDQVKAIIATYRAKREPIDVFALDYDWKAWGQDQYGEWRWNSTNGPGGLNNDDIPDEYPDGASGKFGREMRAQGIHLVGILKPRIFLRNPDGTMHVAAAYAYAHHFWYPGEQPEGNEMDINFGDPAARVWFWQHLEPAFATGIVGWWPDEADFRDGDLHEMFNNFQNFNLGRALYDGQRGYSNLRVWSLNRNFYLGAQRYGYAEWSGDIGSDFPTMQDEPERMLTTLNIGEPHWSMDTGGSQWKLSPENYARWMEFAAFVPIFRVHGGHNTRRQPWMYGPVAEAAAARVMRLRYRLLPYIYSNEYYTHTTGISIVRPLFWVFPSDPQLANDTSAWMFGDAFLVSPILTQGARSVSIYLPQGTWYDYFRGTRYTGKHTITYRVDPKTWSDVPVFVRAGSIVATQRDQQYTGEFPIRTVTLDVFPSSSPAVFTYYDDDGTTYAYERGIYYRQRISAWNSGTATYLHIASPLGCFRPALQAYLVRIHGRGPTRLYVNGRIVRGWSASHDRYGTLTTLTIPWPFTISATRRKGKAR